MDVAETITQVKTADRFLQFKSDDDTTRSPEHLRDVQ
jgi:hypothetical protein